ncbi:MAG TPA: hypothetical protein VE263_22110 [Candidatus Angelobacter sp.]|nr:hypothetical protein [Candidatus Angelobacter sp.]
MHAAQKEALEQHFGAKDWHGRSESGRRLIKEFRFQELEFKGWRLLKVKHAEQGAANVIRSMWSRADRVEEMLSMDVFLCTSVKSAHEVLLEVLGDMESGAIERKTEKNTPGDVAFGLANTMIAFARANLVAVVRNAGRAVVPVGIVARELDSQIQRRMSE